MSDNNYSDSELPSDKYDREHGKAVTKVEVLNPPTPELGEVSFRVKSGGSK